MIAPKSNRALSLALAITLATTFVGGLLACETRLDLGRNDDEDEEDSTEPEADDASARADADPTDATCPAVCDRLDACGALTEADRNECLPSCFAQTTAALRACIVSTPCSQIMETCGSNGGGFGGQEPPTADSFEIEICQDRCDSSKFKDCLTASEHSACRELCTTASAAARESFSRCIEIGGADCATEHDCYAQLSE